MSTYLCLLKLWGNGLKAKMKARKVMVFSAPPEIVQ
jgi:hypothetical protein